MTAKQGCNNFGWTNIITIIIVLSSVIFNYATMTAKVSHLEEAVTTEIKDRKLEDEKIRIRIDGFITENSADHDMLIEMLRDIKDTQQYHLGFHKGEETRMVN